MSKAIQQHDTRKLAACVITLTPSRILLAMVVPSTVWHALFQDFRYKFPTHADAYWNRGKGQYSLPRRHLLAVMEWAASWCTEEHISFREEQPGCGNLAPSMTAVSPTDKEIEALTRTRDRLGQQLRRVPDHGPIARQLKREIANLSDRIAELVAQRAREDGVA